MNPMGNKRMVSSLSVARLVPKHRGGSWRQEKEKEKRKTGTRSDEGSVESHIGRTSNADVYIIIQLEF